MYSFKPEKQNRLYGQIVKNFANAKNTDEACDVLINGVQKAFTFSSNFIEQSENILPSLRKFESKFSKQEKILIKLFLIEEGIKYFLDSQFVFGYANLNVKLIDYSVEKNTLTFQEITCYTSTPGGNDDGGCVFSEPFTIYIKEIEPHIWERMEPRTFNEAERLMKVGSVKKRFMQNVSEKRYSEIKSQVHTYHTILALHEEIKQFQNGIKKTLYEIVKGKKLNESENFMEFLSFYKLHCNLNIDLLSDDTFHYIADFFEKDYYLKEHATTIDSGIFAYFHTSIPFFLVEFFKEPKNKKLIHICDNCGNFYISESKREQRFCSKKCRLKWHNRKRIESGEHAKYKRDRKFNKTVIKKKGLPPASYFG